MSCSNVLNVRHLWTSSLYLPSSQTFLKFFQSAPVPALTFAVPLSRPFLTGEGSSFYSCFLLAHVLNLEASQYSPCSFLEVPFSRPYFPSFSLGTYPGCDPPFGAISSFFVPKFPPCYTHGESLQVESKSCAWPLRG